MFGAIPIKLLAMNDISPFSLSQQAHDQMHNAQDQCKGQFSPEVTRQPISRNEMHIVADIRNPNIQITHNPTLILFSILTSVLTEAE